MKEKPLLPKVNIGKHEAGTAEAGGTRPPETLEEESRLEKFLSDVERRIREATPDQEKKQKMVRLKLGQRLRMPARRKVKSLNLRGGRKAAAPD